VVLTLTMDNDVRFGGGRVEGTVEALWYQTKVYFKL